MGDSTKVSAEPESVKNPDIKRGEANRLDNRNAMKYKPREKDNHGKSSLNLHMITNEKDDEEVKNTKVLEFIPARKPEEAKVGETIRFMHNPGDGSSVYWLRGILDKRMDKYEVAKKSGWKKNRFRVNSISVINIGET